MLLFLFAIAQLITKTHVVQINYCSCNKDGLTFINQINEEREKHNLTKIPTSSSLCTVANEHVEQLSTNSSIYEPPCNLHSWEDCCYTEKNPQCMWLKPIEITNSDSLGYEIAAEGQKDSAGALRSLMNSPNHREVILNEGEWVQKKWKSIGAGIEDKFYVAWFSEEEDDVNC
ncbi:hypothetical protein MHBO_000314 [Bonamia ostreae]|uniref:SCP domain-containing protein n=1 Tax=Bonamia ostreae TaxID=126728 RepID=A0ABV2AF72_9EUKA